MERNEDVLSRPWTELFRVAECVEHRLNLSETGKEDENGTFSGPVVRWVSDNVPEKFKFSIRKS